MDKPIFHAEQCHTGGHECAHNHRSYKAAQRCLPKLPCGPGTQNLFSMAVVVPANDAARAELKRMRDGDFDANEYSRSLR